MTDRRWKAKLVKDKINTELDARYVADGRTLMQPVNTGWRWSDVTSRIYISYTYAIKWSFHSTPARMEWIHFLAPYRIVFFPDISILFFLL